MVDKVADNINFLVQNPIILFQFITLHNITVIQEATTQIQKLPEKGNREVNPV